MALEAYVDLKCTGTVLVVERQGPTKKEIQRSTVVLLQAFETAILISTAEAPSLGHTLFYLLIRQSLILKAAIPRMTRTGIYAYKIRKFAVNLDVAPGQVVSMY